MDNSDSLLPSPYARISLALATFTLFLLCCFYYKIVSGMVSDWIHDPNYSHGFLIPIVTGYLIWLERDRIKKARISPCWWGIILVFLAGCILLLGKTAGEYYSQRFSIIIMLYGCILVFWGIDIFKICFWPIAYLIFMIPLPYVIYNSIAFPLKLFATHLATVSLQALGFPIYSSGNIIYLPHMTLEVADACSGIRSLISILALAVILAKFTQRGWLKRILLVAFSVPIVIAANILRIIITGILAVEDPVLAQGFFHELSGEIIFILGLALLFSVAFILKKIGKKEDRPEDISRERADTSSNNRPAPSYKPVHIIWQVAVIFLISTTFFLSFRVDTVSAVPLLRPIDQFPSKIDGFVQVSSQKMDPKIIKILGVSSYIMRDYKNPSGFVINLYVGYYRQQKEGAMIHSPQHCLPGSGWVPIVDKIAYIRLKNGRTIPVRKYILSKAGQKMIVYYWYQSRGRIIASDYKDRFYLLYDSLLRHRSDGSLVRVIGISNDVKDAEKVERGFIKALEPVLQQFLPN